MRSWKSTSNGCTETSGVCESLDFGAVALEWSPMDGRSSKDSRCSRPEGAPYVWHYFHDSSHDAVQELEEWLSGLGAFARSDILGTLDSLFERASQGQLWRAGERHKSNIEPIWEDPEMYEIRYTALTRMLRFYHGEPERYPSILLSLHKHIKHDDKDQQKQIEFAAERYHSEA